MSIFSKICKYSTVFYVFWTLWEYTAKMVPSGSDPSVCNSSKHHPNQEVNTEKLGPLNHQILCDFIVSPKLFLIKRTKCFIWLLCFSVSFSLDPFFRDFYDFNPFEDLNHLWCKTAYGFSDILWSRLAYAPLAGTPQKRFCALPIASFQVTSSFEMFYYWWCTHWSFDQGDVCKSPPLWSIWEMVRYFEKFCSWSKFQFLYWLIISVWVSPVAQW